MASGKWFRSYGDYEERIFYVVYNDNYMDGKLTDSKYCFIDLATMLSFCRKSRS